jgi:hypothetical protein
MQLDLKAWPATSLQCFSATPLANTFLRALAAGSLLASGGKRQDLGDRPGQASTANVFEEVPLS